MTTVLAFVHRLRAAGQFSTGTPQASPLLLEKFTSVTLQTFVHGSLSPSRPWVRNPIQLNGNSSRRVYHPLEPSLDLLTHFPLSTSKLQVSARCLRGRGGMTTCLRKQARRPVNLELGLGLHRR